MEKKNVLVMRQRENGNIYGMDENEGMAYRMYRLILMNYFSDSETRHYYFFLFFLSRKGRGL